MVKQSLLEQRWMFVSSDEGLLKPKRFDIDFPSSLLDYFVFLFCSYCRIHLYYLLIYIYIYIYIYIFEISSQCPRTVGVD